jgi:hypothetical protein
MNARRNGGVNVSLATMRGERHKSSVSLADENSIQSAFVPDSKPDFKIDLEQDSPLNTVTSSFCGKL